MWYSWKFKKPGLNYEVATNIQTGLIVWMGGPYCASTADMSMLRNDLIHQVEPGEQLVADDGYVGITERERTIIARPVMPGDNNNSRRMKSVARLRHETVNSRFKVWNILACMFREDVELHQEAFFAIGSVIQVMLLLDEPLFAVEYNVIM